ncbi:phage portal protein [Solibacillus isronensis]|uniref:phage portal protein n=1 Tax=Solibacillus isronensis TaxID=412383 RepID=UPI0039A15303
MLFLKELRAGITGDLVKKVYDHYSPQLTAIKSKYTRYTAEELPIHSRDYGEMDEPEIEATLNNDFFGEIIGLKVGHFAGKAASYSYDKTRPEHRDAYNAISRFQVVNNIAHIDTQTTKDAAICGKAYRLLYIDPEQELRVMSLKPYETVTIYENDPTESEFAFRFYKIEQTDGEPIIRADVYDDFKMYEYVFKNDSFHLENERLHLFSYCPVIKYQNNDEEQGDADKVLSLIDAYDRTLSDMNAEITSFRMAYLAFLGGAELTKEQVELMRKIGAFSLPDGTDAKFIVKQLLDAPIENHLNRLEANIYQFSKTPNMRDENFSNNSSGISLKYKLSNIESKCLTFERIKTYADIRQFKIAGSWWEKKKVAKIDAYSVIIQHHRNVPIDLNEIADAVSKYVGILPLEILLDLMPFIDDPEYVLDLIEQEKESLRKQQPEEDDDLDEDVNNDGRVSEVSETA